MRFPVFSDDQYLLYPQFHGCGSSSGSSGRGRCSVPRMPTTSCPRSSAPLFNSGGGMGGAFIPLVLGPGLARHSQPRHTREPHHPHNAAGPSSHQTPSSQCLRDHVPQSVINDAFSIAQGLMSEIFGQPDDETPAAECTSQSTSDQHSCRRCAPRRKCSKDSSAQKNCDNGSSASAPKPSQVAQKSSEDEKKTELRTSPKVHQRANEEKCAAETPASSISSSASASRNPKWTQTLTFPGFAPSKISVKVKNGKMHVHAVQEKTWGPSSCLSKMQVSQTVPLPDTIDQQSLTCSMKPDGTLMICANFKEDLALNDHDKEAEVPDSRDKNKESTCMASCLEKTDETTKKEETAFENKAETVHALEKKSDETLLLESKAEGLGDLENDAEELQSLENSAEEMQFLENKTEEMRALENKAEKMEALENKAEKVEALENKAEKVEALENKAEKVEALENKAEKVEALENKAEKVEALENKAEKVEALENKAERIEALENKTEEKKAVENKLKNMETLQIKAQRAVTLENKAEREMADDALPGLTGEKQDEQNQKSDTETQSDLKDDADQKILEEMGNFTDISFPIIQEPEDKLFSEYEELQEKHSSTHQSSTDDFVVAGEVFTDAETMNSRGGSEDLSKDMLLGASEQVQQEDETTEEQTEEKVSIHDETDPTRPIKRSDNQETTSHRSAFRVSMPLVGFNPEDVHVHLQGHTLNIVAKRQARLGDASYTENVERQVELPGHLDVFSVKCVYERDNGCLIISADPKVEQAQVPIVLCLD